MNNRFFNSLVCFRSGRRIKVGEASAGQRLPWRRCAHRGDLDRILHHSHRQHHRRKLQTQGQAARPDWSARPAIPRSDDGVSLVSVREKPPLCCYRPIEYERSVVAARITFSNVAESRRTVIDSTGLNRRCVESIDLLATPPNKCRVLLNTVRVKAIDSENWVFHTIADAVSAVVRGAA